MRIGAIFPQIEIGDDPAAIRDFAQAVESLGYAHILAYDHVLGAHPDRFAHLLEGKFRPPYNHETPFHEPFVLFGFLAAATKTIELTTGIVILPQRQTALVAKQAAEVDVLSGGRLRLGVGIGWNYTEFEALNENFRNRGRRVEEQIALMRQLWTSSLVDFEGRWHTVKQSGINPLPVQRPIPVWMGGGAEDALKRMARIADGWFPQFRPGEQGTATLERLRGWVRESGRDPAAFGIEGRINLMFTKDDGWQDALAWWKNDAAASHVSFNTMGCGLTSVKQHIDAFARFMEAAKAFAA
jgi:probable F420-dependent oxidoreductase